MANAMTQSCNDAEGDDNDDGDDDNGDTLSHAMKSICLLSDSLCLYSGMGFGVHLFTLLDWLRVTFRFPW